MSRRCCCWLHVAVLVGCCAMAGAMVIEETSNYTIKPRRVDVTEPYLFKNLYLKEHFSNSKNYFNEDSIIGKIERRKRHLTNESKTHSGYEPIKRHATFLNFQPYRVFSAEHSAMGDLSRGNILTNSESLNQLASSHIFRHGHIPSNIRDHGRYMQESPLDTELRTHIGASGLNLRDDASAIIPSTDGGASGNSVEWVQEPAARLVFSNNSGGMLQCAVDCGGGSAADVVWKYVDGRHVATIPEILSLLPNGSLALLPFSRRLFDPAVHETSFTCTATCDAASLLSRPAVVKAVISEAYEAQVYDHMALFGNTANMKCQLPDAVKDFVVVTSWLKDGSSNIFPSLFGDEKHHMLGSGDLHILSVTPEDGRWRYQCRTRDVLTGETRLSRGSARIIVTESTGPIFPRILETPSVVASVQGAVVTLPCVAEGQPPPTVSWTKDGSPLQLSVSTSWPGLPDGPKLVGGSLVLPAVQVEHEGDYRCIANSSAGHASKSTLLTVNVPLSVQVTPRRVQVDVGARLTLHCRVNGSPSADITWFKDAAKLSPSTHLRVSATELAFSLVSVEDAGLYQCRATRGERDVAHAHARVILGSWAPRLLYRFIAHTLQPGPAVTLKCIARATPTPNIAWTLDGFPLPQSHRFLIGQYVTPHGDVISHVNISSVRVSDGGLYECVAQNSAGTASHSARLNVYGEPTIRQVEPLTAVAGETFRVRCPVGGYPIDRITWKKDGQELPSSHRQRVNTSGLLQVMAVVRELDQGSYSCTAEGRQGASDTREMFLQVIVAPEILPFEFPSYQNAGERVGVTCIVSKGDQVVTMIWYKDGVLLQDLNQPHTILLRQTDYSSILMISSLTIQHSGIYTCNAISDVAADDEHSVELIVNVPPRIGALSFPEDTRAGMRTQVTCFVQEGDLPIDIHWVKNGHRIEPTPNIRLTKVDDHTTILVIDKAESVHSGNYSCVAANAAKTVASTARLSVNVPPTWSSAPVDSPVPLGGSVAIVCGATGFPHPNVTWSRETASGEWAVVEQLRMSNLDHLLDRINEPKNTDNAIDFGSRFNNNRISARFVPKHSHVYANNINRKITEKNILKKIVGARSDSNGTLAVMGVTRNDEGKYLCQASNGVGPGLSKVIKLTVHEPPWFGERQRQVQVEVGSLARLTCRAHGDSPLNLVWTRDGSTLPTRHRYQLRLMKNDDGSQELELSIQEAASGDSGVYVCKATNPHGTSATDVTLAVEDVPSAPTGLSVQEEGPRFVTLSWSPPANAEKQAVPVTQYIIAYNVEDREDPLTQEVSVLGGSRTHRLVGLCPATWYNIVVSAQNRVGRSPTSASLRHLTQEEKPEGIPRNVQVTSTSSRSVRVHWLPPLRNSTHGRLLGYYLGIREHNRIDSSRSYNFTTVGGDASRTHAIVSDLRPHTQYDVVLQAFNSMGAGPASEPVLGATMQDKPSSPPESVSCSARSASCIEVRWKAPESGGRNGVIRRYHLGYSAENIQHGEQWGNNYGPQLLLSRALTSNLLDSAVHDMSRPQNSTLQGALIVSDDRVVAEIPGLMPWSNYSVVVAAATEAGVGVASEPVICTTKEDVPSAPHPIKAVSVGPHSAIVSWKSPLFHHGRLTYYTVYWNTSKQNFSIRSRNVKPHLDYLKLQDLAQEQVTVWVTASTTVGEGPASEIASVTPSKIVAAAVWSVGGTVGAVWLTDVTLLCRAVGVPKPNITWWHEGVMIQESSLTGATQSNDGSLILTSVGRSQGGRYTCEARNGLGRDTVTYIVTVRVPPSPPSVHVTETTSSSIRLQWDVADDGGAPVTSCTMYHRIPGGDTVRTIVKGFSHTVYDLKCGSEFHFYLTAHNFIGTSEASEVVKARTKGRPPEAPPQFQFVTSNSSQATLYLTQWEDGGCPITHYLVQYRDSHTQHWTTVDSEVLPSRTFAITGLTGGSSYDVRVTAHNAAGAKEGLYSVRTPMEKEAGATTQWRGEDGSSPSTVRPALWRDLRLVIPVTLSCLALLVTLAKVGLCVRKSRQDNCTKKEDVQLSQKEGLPGSNEKQSLGGGGAAGHYRYPGQISSEEEPRHGSLGNCDVYQYASASCQLGRLSPPPLPPVSSSPAHAQHGRRHSGENSAEMSPDDRSRSYATLVYQIPSLSNVDAARKGCEMSSKHDFDHPSLRHHDSLLRTTRFVPSQDCYPEVQTPYDSYSVQEEQRAAPQHLHQQQHVSIQERHLQQQETVDQLIGPKYRHPSKLKKINDSKNAKKNNFENKRNRLDPLKATLKYVEDR